MVRYIEKLPVYGRITDEALESLRKRLGAEIVGSQQFLSQINKDAVRHFAHGQGDYNPHMYPRKMQFMRELPKTADRMMKGNELKQIEISKSKTKN